MLLYTVKQFFLPLNQAGGQKRMEKEEQKVQKSLITRYIQYYAGEAFAWSALVHKCAFILLVTF